MPYIITTHRHLDDPTGEFLPGALPAVSRVAVATLEEARRAIVDTYGGVYGYLETLAEAGGTIGPLPDGTIIEVERVDWQVSTDAEIVARFNAS